MGTNGVNYGKTLKPTELTKAIEGLLNEYADELHVTIEQAEEATAKLAVQNLRRVPDPRKTGDYAKGWRWQYNKQPTKGYEAVVIYNSEKPTLTYLLENGHAVKRGGRTVGEANAHPHIEPAQRDAEQFFLNKLEEALNK